MRLRHATPMRNVRSIDARGLLVSKATGKIKAVWLHAPARTPWAMLHTVRRHGGKVERVAVYEIEVPRSWCRRHASGLWYVTRDVPASRIVRRIEFVEVSRSPISEV